MNSEYTFSGGNRIKADISGLHMRSAGAAQTALRPGDFIEVGIERKPVADGESPILVENVFARVEAVGWPFIDAIVCSKVRFSKFHGVRAGDTISCSDEQILCFLPADDPKTGRWIKFVTEKAVEMQRAFLMTLTLEELPKHCFTKCVLDTHITVFMHPMDDKSIGIFVGIDVVDLPVPDGRSADAIWNATRFHEAAEKLGFISGPPSQIVPSARNQLVLDIELSADGRQLIDLVSKSIEEIHQEAAHVLAEQAAEAKQP